MRRGVHASANLIGTVALCMAGLLLLCAFHIWVAFVFPYRLFNDCSGVERAFRRAGLLGVAEGSGLAFTPPFVLDRLGRQHVEGGQELLFAVRAGRASQWQEAAGLLGLPVRLVPESIYPDPRDSPRLFRAYRPERTVFELDLAAIRAELAGRCRSLPAVPDRLLGVKAVIETGPTMQFSYPAKSPPTVSGPFTSPMPSDRGIEIVVTQSRPLQRYLEGDASYQEVSALLAGIPGAFEEFLVYLDPATSLSPELEVRRQRALEGPGLLYRSPYLSRLGGISGQRRESFWCDPQLCIEVSGSASRDELLAVAQSLR